MERHRLWNPTPPGQGRRRTRPPPAEEEPERRTAGGCRHRACAPIDNIGVPALHCPAPTRLCFASTRPRLHLLRPRPVGRRPIAKRHDLPATGLCADEPPIDQP